MGKKLGLHMVQLSYLLQYHRNFSGWEQLREGPPRSEDIVIVGILVHKISTFLKRSFFSFRTFIYTFC